MLTKIILLRKKFINQCKKDDYEVSVLMLDDKRILLNRISRYELDSDELYYRNDNEEETFLLIWILNQDDLWSKYRFNYLSIKMVDGKSYKFYSDKKLYKLMKEMDEYFKENDIGFDDEILDEDEHLRKAVESYTRIRDKFIFVDEKISYIANRIDHAFGTI